MNTKIVLFKTGVFVFLKLIRIFAKQIKEVLFFTFKIKGRKFSFINLKHTTQTHN